MDQLFVFKGIKPAHDQKLDCGVNSVDKSDPEVTCSELPQIQGKKSPDSQSCGVPQKEEKIDP